METNQFNYSFFKDSLPVWKRKKDPILTQIFYRPFSFLVASFCAKMNISANTVSYFSTIIGIIACVLFLVDDYLLRIIAATLINIWLILDCVDGNLARSVKKQSFGEFADGISSYVLVALVCITIGFSVYFTGGIIFEKGSPWIILLGALASIADTLMRLIYQKFRSELVKLEDKGLIAKEEDARTDHSKVTSFRVKVESELGIGGLLPIFILIAAITNALDLVVIYCFLYYGFSCVVSSCMFIRKAISLTKEIDK